MGRVARPAESITGRLIHRELAKPRVWGHVRKSLYNLEIEKTVRRRCPVSESQGQMTMPVEALGVDGISVVFENYTYSAPGLAAATQERGLLAFAWNFGQIPDTPERMRTAIEIGLDGYIVNDPEMFASVIPEPGTLLLVGMGVAALSWVSSVRGRRR